jgi:hypothetical protein
MMCPSMRIYIMGIVADRTWFLLEKRHWANLDQIECCHEYPNMAEGEIPNANGGL